MFRFTQPRGKFMTLVAMVGLGAMSARADG